MVEVTKCQIWASNFSTSLTFLSKLTVFLILMIADDTTFCSVGLKSNQKAFIYLHTTYVKVVLAGSSCWGVRKYILEVPQRMRFLMV